MEIVTDMVTRNLKGSSVDKDVILNIVERKNHNYQEEMIEILNIVLDKIFSSDNSPQ